MQKHATTHSTVNNTKQCLNMNAKLLMKKKKFYLNAE